MELILISLNQSINQAIQTYKYLDLSPADVIIPYSG